MAAHLIAPARLRTWTAHLPYRNLWPLVIDYSCVAALHGTAIYIWTHLDTWGWSRWWLLPLSAATIVLTGCLIHRIGLMGHEASHYLLFRDRRLNDLMAELLCFFPLWSSLARYRAKHLGHHLYPNQAQKDPNLAGEKAEKLWARFPMPKPSFIYHYYLKFFWPPFVFRNLYDLLRVLSIGEGFAPVDPDSEIRKPLRDPKTPGLTRSATLWGVLYLAALIGLIYATEATGIAWLVIAGPVGFYALATLIWARMPESYFNQVPAKLNYDPKFGGWVRMTFYSSIFFAISWVRHFAGFDLAPFYLLFWIFPLIYVFPYLMLLREIYQHANLGTGDLDNSRIIHSDPFTRWAVLGYGNDFHLVHHLYPNIPHYRLREVHGNLAEASPDYRDQCEVVRGMFKGTAEEAALLDALEAERHPATTVKN